MSKVFPPGTRFLDHEGRVLMILKYSGKETRAYCDIVCDAYPLPVPPRGSTRGMIGTIGGHYRYGGKVTPLYFEATAQRLARIITFDKDEEPEALSARMAAALEAAQALFENAAHYREQADMLEQRGRARVYDVLGIELNK